MHDIVYDSIDQIPPEAIAPLRGSPLDYSHGLLRAIERSLWGDLEVCYVAVYEGETLLAFTPIYSGRDLDLNATMPKAFNDAYTRVLDAFGQSQALKSSLVGTPISDLGSIPIHPDCDAPRVVAKILTAIDEVNRDRRAEVCLVKDFRPDYPHADVFAKAGYAKLFSLPAVTLDTRFASFEDYVASLSTNGRSHARRTMRHAAKHFTVRVVEDYAAMIPDIYPLFRATFMKSEVKLEELSPGFFLECSRMSSPKSELLVCERDGKPVGFYLILHSKDEQHHKRVGMDYAQPDTGTIYNILNYHCIKRAIERQIPLCSLGQTSYVPKIRLRGRLEEMVVFTKGYTTSVRLSVPLQRRWMDKYRVEEQMKRIEATLHAGAPATQAGARS